MKMFDLTSVQFVARALHSHQTCLLICPFTSSMRMVKRSSLPVHSVIAHLSIQQVFVSTQRRNMWLDQNLTYARTVTSLLCSNVHLTVTCVSILVSALSLVQRVEQVSSIFQTCKNMSRYVVSLPNHMNVGCRNFHETCSRF